MSVRGSVAAVVESVRADVDAEVERLERETAHAVEAAEKEASAASKSSGSAREPLLAEARREAREILAHEASSERRDALEEREKWVRSVLDEARRRLRAGGGVEAGVARALAREALSRLLVGRTLARDVTLELVVDESAAALFDDAWRAETARALGIERISVVGSKDPAFPGGCVARTADGRVLYDDTWPAREARFETALRTALSGLLPP